MNYWSDRVRLKSLAVAHTATMAQKFRSEIQCCIESTEDFADDAVLPCLCDKSDNMNVTFESTGSVETLESVYSFHGGRVCVLDFADYMHPGGKFLEGSGAQEERLCHSSFLYNVLKSDHVKQMFYDKHKGLSRKCLYSNHLLYIPQVLFDESVPCDVIVCAAPNKGAAIRYHQLSASDVNLYMRDRCNAVLQAAAYKRVDHLILGAFGCGVFGNDPQVVSGEFKSLLCGRYRGSFKTVVFAVPDERNGQYFRAVCNM